MVETIFLATHLQGKKKGEMIMDCFLSLYSIGSLLALGIMFVDIRNHKDQPNIIVTVLTSILIGWVIVGIKIGEI